jgi:murein L,D-transpeptidase YcbB/YkuD
VMPAAAGQNLALALRLARALAAGLVEPAAVQRDWTIAAPNLDADAALQTLGASEDPLPWLRALAPQHAEYRQLQQALAAYGALAQRGGWPMLPEGAAPKRGARDPRWPVLATRLGIEGDLAPGAGAMSDAAIEQALRRFQERHGLAVDGRLGDRAIAALNADAAARYRQIAANLERWRWLPHRLPEDRIVVNTAAAGLTLIEGGRSVLALRVIVGKPRTPTPVLAARIGSLLINPPWDIPATIARKEIRPRAQRDPGYLERENIVLREDGSQLRQLPGPKNALGRLKFEMPNPLDVYLHDTPDKRLFERTPRLFSHGCIRLEQPQALALRLLHDSAWTTATIEQAIADGGTRRVPIAPSLPIYVVYFTAAAAGDGTVALYDDPYERDAPLIDALSPAAAPALLAARSSARPGGCPPG